MFPYGCYALTPRLSIWVTAGYGWGKLSLDLPGDRGATSTSTNLSMVAGGIDGFLIDGAEAGVSLSSTADLLLLRTTSAEEDALPSADGSLSRFRLGLEATRPFPLANGSSLSPSMEVGIRRDWGDAETGYGVDLGAGIREKEFHDSGVAVSFVWEPTPSNRGPSFSMSYSLGATAADGMAALLNPITIEVLDSSSGGQQFEAELAYGFPSANDHLIITPTVGLALSSDRRS